MTLSWMKNGITITESKDLIEKRQNSMCDEVEADSIQIQKWLCHFIWFESIELDLKFQCQNNRLKFTTTNFKWFHVCAVQMIQMLFSIFNSSTIYTMYNWIECSILCIASISTDPYPYHHHHITITTSYITGAWDLNSL